ncbi:hypothetical protein CFOL_v3_01220, partial [Cephalotus follicularis]
ICTQRSRNDCECCAKRLLYLNDLKPFPFSYSVSLKHSTIFSSLSPSLSLYLTARFCREGDNKNPPLRRFSFSDPTKPTPPTPRCIKPPSSPLSRDHHHKATVLSSLSRTIPRTQIKTTKPPSRYPQPQPQRLKPQLRYPY